MAVRIRMKKLGRRHRPFFRVCAVDSRKARDGKVIEYLGYYDPMIQETDARTVLNGERIDYWLSVGARPSDKVSVLIKKYGTNGTHLEQQKQARERIEASKPTAPPPLRIQPKAEEPAEAESPAADTAQADASADEAQAAEPTQEEKAPAAEASSDETPQAEEQAKPEGGE